MTEKAFGHAAGKAFGHAAGQASGHAAGHAHVDALRESLDAVDGELDRIQRWSRHLVQVLLRGGRLLAAGNGGSAAQAQHLTSELVGRYCHDRPGFSAISLHVEPSSFTAIGNDYGFDSVFARQVQAHGRPGDILVALSTSGRSPNVVKAVEAARRGRLATWGITGPSPNPIASLCDDAVCIQAETTATIQEAHLVVVHLLCEQFDAEIGAFPEHTQVRSRV